MQQFDLFTQHKDAAALSNPKDTAIDASATSGKSNKRHLLRDESEFFDGELHYIRGFLTQKASINLFYKLQQDLAWEQSQIRIYGKWQTIPRLQAWYGDAEAAYQYSGVMMEPLKWTDELQKLRDACQNTCQRSFNSVLANLYRNGNDCMGFHSDDEPELGREPVIASLTLGGTRNFDLLHKKLPCKLRLPLEPGSLLVMKGTTQDNWSHGIARTKRVVEPRINLTFRRILNQF